MALQRPQKPGRIDLQLTTQPRKKKTPDITPNLSVASAGPRRPGSHIPAPGVPRRPQNAVKSDPPAVPPVVWVIIVAVIAVISGVVYVYNHNKDQQADIAATLKRNADRKAEADAHNAKIKQQREEDERRKAEREKAEAEAAQRQQELAAQQAAEEEARRAAAEQQAAEQSTPTTSEEFANSEYGSDSTETTDEPAEDDSSEPAEINLSGEVSAETLAAFESMVTSAVENKHFLGLQSSLADVLKTSFPSEDPGKDNSWHSARVKGKPAQRALFMYRALHLAEASAGGAEGEQEFTFLTWLITDKKFPAGQFIAAIDKHKVPVEDAADMMDELRSFYADEPTKAVAEIRSITNPASAGGLSKKLYPVTKKEQQATLKKILATKAPRNVPAVQQEGVNMANAFRYLCGVEPCMEFDKEFHSQAQEAAETCRKAGHIAHDLGGHTDKCNLFQGLSDPAKSVTGYMNDPGPNNRERRGHRAWILDPPAAKTAFGIDGGFGAMRVMNYDGKKFPKDGHSYPGRGFYPADFLHGDGWSYYPPRGTEVSGDPEVEMWRLSGSAKTKPKASQLKDGSAIDIKAVFKGAGGGIVFEPDYSQMRTKDGRPHGVYWVRISWSGFRTEYVVDLY